MIGAVNDDPKVRMVVHVGDIKSGSTTCTDERLAAVHGAFETFEDPVVVHPGRQGVRCWGDVVLSCP